MAKFEKRERKGKHKLPVKKVLKVYPSETHPNFYRIGYEEGGVVGKDLDSEFTNRRQADLFLETYLANYEKNKSYLDHVRDKEYGKAESKERI